MTPLAPKRPHQRAPLRRHAACQSPRPGTRAGVAGHDITENRARGLNAAVPSPVEIDAVEAQWRTQ